MLLDEVISQQNYYLMWSKEGTVGKWRVIASRSLARNTAGL